DEHRRAGSKPAAAAAAGVSAAAAIAAMGGGIGDGDVVDGDLAALDEEDAAGVVGVDGEAVAVDGDRVDPVAADHRQRLCERDVAADVDEVVDRDRAMCG